MSRGSIELAEVIDSIYLSVCALDKDLQVLSRLGLNHMASHDLFPAVDEIIIDFFSFIHPCKGSFEIEPVLLQVFGVTISRAEEISMFLFGFRFFNLSIQLIRCKRSLQFILGWFRVFVSVKHKYVVVFIKNLQTIAAMRFDFPKE